MAMAGKVTIVQTQNVVSLGALDPETIITPGIFVNRIVEVPEPAIESQLVAAGVTYP
jgi:3-oxoadipate CoA-transferase alpha subunit